MYRAISNFSIGNTEYKIGDTIAASDNEAIQNDAHYRQFVVPITLKIPNPFPTPNS